MGYLADIIKMVDKVDNEQDIIFVGTGIILINDNNEILAGQRADNKLWSLPGGSLEIGESLQQCIIRETFEETNITIKEKDLALNWVEALKEPVIKNKRKIHIVSVSFICRTYDDEYMQLDSREFLRYGWFRADEILKLDITEYTRVALSKMIENKTKN